MDIHHQTLSISDIESARALSRLFTQHMEQGTELKIGTETIQLSNGVAQLMLELVTQVATGHSVSIVPSDTDLTTAETAELLNVSRPYVVQLLTEGKLPFHRVGSHRRVALEDALLYKKNQRQKSLEVMKELTEEAQELGYGY